MPADRPTNVKACASGLDNDLPYVACLSYCALAAHCVKCEGNAHRTRILPDTSDEALRSTANSCTDC